MNLATRARYRHPEPLFIKLEYGKMNDKNKGYGKALALLIVSRCIDMSCHTRLPSEAEVRVERERVELRCRTTEPFLTCSNYESLLLLSFPGTFTGSDMVPTVQKLCECLVVAVECRMQKKMASAVSQARRPIQTKIPQIPQIS